jgi:hypothetical protein
MATASFDSRCIDLSLKLIMPVRTILPSLRGTAKYRQINASLCQIGLVEPLVVFPNADGTYLLLDGHVRYDILKMMQAPTVRCTLATDDEAHTYNKRVNRLSTIEEHRMILKAIQHGVTEERIASVLNVNIAAIRKKRDLLDGICPETVDLLKDKHVTADAFKILRRMKPTRQVEVAELMTAARNYSVSFMKALLAGTPASLLTEPDRPRPKVGLSAEQKSMIEHETDVLLRDLKSVEDTYGTEILDFTLAYRYIERIVRNERVQRYLSKHHAELLYELTALLHEVACERASTTARNDTPNQPSKHQVNSCPPDVNMDG